MAAAGTISPMMLAATGLLLVGFAFKISAVPFHMWTPDAYEGAPTVVTGFMSTGVKAAAFAAFVRVFLSAFDPLRADWVPVLWGIAMLTMIVGTVVGVAQSNLKRMLAYSSIAHAGYLLVGLVAANEVGKAAILFYLLVYALTNLGAFGIIALLSTGRSPARGTERLQGPVVRASGARGPDDRVPALAGRPAADGGLRQQVVHLQRGGALRPLRPGYRRHAVERGVGVLLPARRRDDVHGRAHEAQPRPAIGAVPFLALVASMIALFYLGILPTRVLDLAASSVSTIF
jgi:NADH-quinone oxidoreductase subunit N